MKKDELVELSKLAHRIKDVKLLPKDHPCVVAMCDAAYGKAQNHKRTKQLGMWAALLAALRYLES
jgi:hypothetical protein